MAETAHFQPPTRRGCWRGHTSGSETSWDLPSGEHGEAPSVDPAAHWLTGNCPWLVKSLLPRQGFRVNSGLVRGLCLNPRTCVPLTRWDLGSGYGLGLSVYCAELPLPQATAQPNCVHALMCFFIYICFVTEWQGSWNALIYEDTLVSAVLCLSACLRVRRSMTRGVAPHGNASLCSQEGQAKEQGKGDICQSVHISLQPIVVCSNLQSLQTWHEGQLDTPSGPAARGARWQQRLAKFDLNVVYVLRKDNTVADCLLCWAYPAGNAWMDIASQGDAQEMEEAERIIALEKSMEQGEIKCFVMMASKSELSQRRDA